MLPRFRPTMTLSMHLRAMSQGALMCHEAALNDVARLECMRVYHDMLDAASEVTWARLEVVEASPIGWSILRPESELREMGL